MHYRNCPNCGKTSHKKEKLYQYLPMTEIFECPKCTLIWHREQPFGQVEIQFFKHIKGKRCKCIGCAESIDGGKKLKELEFKLYPDE